MPKYYILDGVSTSLYFNPLAENTIHIGGQKSPKRKIKLKKIRKKRTYDALYISDIHYLIDKQIRDHAHDELFVLLDAFRKKNILFRKIILVGDILESWYFSAARHLVRNIARFDELFGRLDQVCSKGGLKYYIVGNHDTTSYTQGLANRISDYLRDRNWLTGEWYQNDKIIAIHGHQGQYSKTKWMFDIFIVRLLHFLARFFPGFFKKAESFYNKHLNRTDPVTNEEKIQYYSRLSKIVNQRDRVLITGHTHDFLVMPELRIINTGDWISSRSFVIQDGNIFIGCRLRPKGVKKVFEVDFTS